VCSSDLLNEDHYLDKLGIYFTMLYMIINIKEKYIRFTRAGHNPPVILRADGRIEIPESGGLPVGLDFPRDDEVVELPLASRDRIYLYSDGITEAANSKDEQYTQARFVKIINQYCKLPMDEILNHLMDDLKTFTGRDSFEDDISVIGLSFN